MIIELVYITVYYRCGCVKARPVQPPRVSRGIFAHRDCDVCFEQAQRDEARRAEMQKMKQDMAVRYLVDGHPMMIYQQKGYWRGRRYEGSKPITKSFGKNDPRLLLEEVLL